MPDSSQLRFFTQAAFNTLGVAGGKPTSAAIAAELRVRFPDVSSLDVDAAVADFVQSLPLPERAEMALADGLHPGKLRALARQIAAHRQIVTASQLPEFREAYALQHKKLDEALAKLAAAGAPL